MRLDRKQACDDYCERYPDDEWDGDIHFIVSDYNFADHWIFGAIAEIANKLKDDDENQDLRRRFIFMINLLLLPMPEGWNDDDGDDEDIERAMRGTFEITISNNASTITGIE